MAAAILASCAAKKTAHGPGQGIAGTASESASAVSDDSTTGNLIIYYDPETGNKELLDAAKKYGSKILYLYKNFNGIAVTVPKEKSVEDAIKYYEAVKGVQSVNRDRIMHLD